MMKEKIKIADFDDVLPYIGGFGKYQFIIFILLCVVNCYFSFIYYGQIFMTLKPPHWCRWNTSLEYEILERFDQNLTQDELKHLLIPRTESGLDYQKCYRYDVSIDEIQFVNGTLEPNPDWPITSCSNGWMYDYSLYYPTISSELNWVCDDDWKAPSAQALFFIGCMIGTMTFGWMADAFGRIPIAMGSNILAGVFGIASSYTTSFTTFCIFRFIVGLAFDSNFHVFYILGLEFVSAKYRTIIANVPFVIFLTASMCAMPWIAYFIHDWKMFGVAIHAPFLLAVFLPCLAPESVRWLLEKGKHEKAMKTVTQAAKVNGKSLSVEFNDAFKSYAYNMSQRPAEKVTWLDLLKTPTLRKRFLILCLTWISIFLAYDGHVRHTESIGANIFISFTLMGAVELPGDIISMIGMEYFGRKFALIWSMFVCGIVTLAMMTVPPSETTMLVTLGVAGRFFITIAMNVGMQYMVEILPTAGRAQGSSAIHTAGFGMAFISPYILYSGKIQPWLPYLLFGAISIMGAMISVFLPETNGEKLPDTLEDGETYFKGQPLLFNPCKKVKESEIAVEEKYTKNSSLNSHENVIQGEEIQI